MDNLSFTLRAGQTLALVGESGSGKSTVVRALAQLQKRAAGEILLDGGPRPDVHLCGLRAYRHEVQLVFQDPFASLNPMHTVRHHLARPILMLHPAHSRARLDEEVAELLGLVNLTPAEEIAGKYPHELSGGQRQRVAIVARAGAVPRAARGRAGVDAGRVDPAGVRTRLDQLSVNGIWRSSRSPTTWPWSGVSPPRSW